MLVPSDSATLRHKLEKTLGLSTKLAFFPVRHHSPTCARHLLTWLYDYKPDAVLIEGPALYNDRIDILADSEHEAPFALVSVARAGGDILGRAYYPFCDYSPELVALRVARQIGAKTLFIDLVHGERKNDLDAEIDATQAEERLGAAEDSNLARSRFTQAIVAQSGCRDFDEVWESLFEQAGWNQTPEDWALAVATYAHLSRTGYTRVELESDATLDRERFMAAHIQQAQQQFKRIAVITGAFHTVALRDTSPAKLKKSKASPSVEVFLAPYTFPRLDALLGYASGMSGPQFYQYVWEARTMADPFAIAARRVLVEASRLARTDGEVLGTADAIAALSFAHDLAAFRGRARVGRVELIEAAQTCFVKGDTQLVGRRVVHAISEIMRGKKVGRLGESAGQSLLVQDFHRKLKELRLPVEHGRPQAQELSIFASNLALARSRFFQQCTFLELEFCERQRGPDLGTGQDMHLSIEHWTVQYVPEVEARLAELAHLGATIEDVAGALVVKACLSSEGKSGELALHLLRGLLMGLHKLAERLVPRLAAAMFSDDDVLSLLSAGRLLRTMLKGRERLEAALVNGIPQLAQQAFLQGTLRLPRLASIGPDRLDEILDALSSLLDVVLTERNLAPRQQLLLTYATEARDSARAKAPAVLGAMEGFLLQIGETQIEAIAKNMAAFRGTPDGIGAYLEGVLAIARQALLGDSMLLRALIEHVRDTEWQTFLASLPSLRRAMTRLTPRETEAIADRAAAILGISQMDAVQLLEAPPDVVSRLSDWEQDVVIGEQSWAATSGATQ